MVEATLNRGSGRVWVWPELAHLCWYSMSDWLSCLETTSVGSWRGILAGPSLAAICLSIICLHNLLLAQCFERMNT